MSASRLLIFAACGLAGYFGAKAVSPRRTAASAAAPVVISPALEASLLVAEWEKMRGQFGPTPGDFPAAWFAVKETPDAFRRAAFQAALLSEWIGADPPGALAFLQENDRENVSEFFREWLRLDPANAITALLADEKSRATLRGLLRDIAKSAPERLAEAVGALAKSEAPGDSAVREAFAIFALNNPGAARAAAESTPETYRGQALAGAGKVLAAKDGPAALAWAQAMPPGGERDAALKGVLTGWAEADPFAALDRIELVPPGAEQGRYASDIAADLLRVAAGGDWTGTIQWLRTHPGKIGAASLDGMQEAMSKRLHTDPAGTLQSLAESGLPYIENMLANSLLNEGYPQHDAIRRWLDVQPSTAFTEGARAAMLHAVAFRDPEKAIEWIEKIPDTPENQPAIQRALFSLLNGGDEMDDFESLLEKISQKLRPALIDAAFIVGRKSIRRDPARWIGRINELAPERRSDAISGLVSAWAGDDPTAALAWVQRLPSEKERVNALSAAVAGWAESDPLAAAQWLDAQQNGSDRDISTEGLVSALATSAPEDAWTWAQSIRDPARRLGALRLAQTGLRMKNPVIAKELLESAQLTRAEIEALKLP